MLQPHQCFYYTNNPIYAVIVPLSFPLSLSPSLPLSLPLSLSLSLPLSLPLSLSLSFCLFRLLINFTEDRSEPDWKGYLYAVLLFLTAVVQSLLLHQYFHRCFLVGMRVRTAIVSAVYNKVVHMYLCGPTTVYSCIHTYVYTCYCTCLSLFLTSHE